MNSHKLAKLLLNEDDVPVMVSVDISTGEEDAFARTFGEVVELQNNSTGGKDGKAYEIILLAIEA